MTTATTRSSQHAQAAHYASPRAAGGEACKKLSVRQRRHRLDGIHPPHGLVVRCQHIAPQQAEEAAARTLAIAAIALRLHPRCGRGAVLDVSCRMCRPCIGRGPTIVAVAQLWDTNDHLVLTHAWLADRLHVDALVRSLGEHVLVGHTHTRARAHAITRAKRTLSLLQQQKCTSVRRRVPVSSHFCVSVWRHREQRCVARQPPFAKLPASRT